MRINAIAVDDEVLALQKIKRFCKQVEYINLMEIFNNPLDAIYFLKHNRVDLMFLDIQMDEISGIEMISRIDKSPLVILTTAFSHYSLKAFDLDVVDYLLKPIRFDRFRKAADRAYAKIKLEIKASDKSPEQDYSSEEKFIFIKSGRQRIKIYLNDILYIEGMKDYLAINTIKGKYLTLQVFNTMLDQLPEESFLRVHRSFIVSLDKIENVSSGKITIYQKDIPVSKTYRDKFESRFSEFAGSDKN